MSDDEADESEVPTILPKNKPSASYKRSPSSENEEQLLELLAGRLLWQEKWSKMTAAYWSKLPQNLLRNVELHLGPISLDNAATIFLKTDEAGMVRTGTAMSRVVQGIKNHAFKHLPGELLINYFNLMAPGIKDKYFKMTPSFKFCKFKLNLIEIF